MLTNLLNSISLALASVVYFILKQLFIIFFTIAKTSLFSKNVLNAFLNRAWLFIGIIMLFKMAISLINYLVNPDDFDNEKTGFSKLVQRVLVSLFLLAFCRIGFNTMYYFQSIIIDQSIINKIILGSGNTSTTYDTNDQADQLVISLFEGAYQIDANYGKRDEIISIIKKDDLTKLSSYIDGVNVKYYMFADVAIGLFCCYVVFLYCIDISIRTIRLSFYEMLAPIPIMMYIDPKKGDERLGNYFKAVGTTFAVLFVRIAIICFISLTVYLLSTLVSDSPQMFCYISSVGVTNECGLKNQSLGFFAVAFIVVGMFMFAKQAPQLLKDLTGIDPDKNSPGLFSLRDRVHQLPHRMTEGFDEREKHRLDQRNARRQQAREARQNAYMNRHGITDANDPRNLGFLGNIRHPISAYYMRQAQIAHADATARAANEAATQQNLEQLTTLVSNLVSRREGLRLDLTAAQAEATAAAGAAATAKTDFDAGRITQEELHRYQDADNQAREKVTNIKNNISNINTRIQTETDNVETTRAQLAENHTLTSAAQRQERVANTASSAHVPNGRTQDRMTAANHANGH